MNNTILYGMLFIGGFTGLLMALTQWMVTSQKYGQYRIRTPQNVTIPLSRKVVNIGLNMLFMVLLFIAALYHLSDKLIAEGHASGVTIFGEVLAVLLIYDFCYYFMHRTLHHPRLMKFVHGVHHRSRFPTPAESLFLNPIEGFAGVTLLLGTTMAIGPVSGAAFLIIVFLHSVINVLVHANMVLPHPLFKLTNFWATKHDFHHGHHLNRNYASIFPFWDLMFGTYK